MHPEDQKRIGDWRWRLTNLYKIQTKKAEKITFKPKPIQKLLMKYVHLWHLILVLKARQEGVSTFFLLYHLDRTLFKPNCTTVILAHRRDSLQKLFRIIKIAYESCPERIRLADGRIWVKPKAKYDTKNELYFEGLDSRIYVALEVRSDTVHGLHVSEWAHIKNADNVLTATLGAVVEGGVITGETTANGEGGSFHDEWENPDSDFLKLFFGYQHDPDYSDVVEDEEAFRKTLTAEEQQLLTVPDMKLGNIAWRRRQLRMKSRRKKFKQEFPCTPSEAFLTSGASPFNREKIEDWNTRPPLEATMEGMLEYWVKPLPDRRYILSVDCSSGASGSKKPMGTDDKGGSDFTAMGVWDLKTWQKVAQFRGRYPYGKLHHIVYKLGKEYNDAYVAIETFPSGHGMTVCNNLVNNVGIDGEQYPQYMIHTTTSIDKKTNERKQRWGWETNERSKTLMVDHMTDLIEDEEITIYSETAKKEFKRFIINDKGQYQAMEGYHDDIVMESCIAMYLVKDALAAGRRTFSREELGLQGM